MDWTLKTPLQWDWETLALFSAKESEIPKPAQQPYWKFDGGHENKYGNGSVCTSGGGACSVSELGNGSSRTSISAFIGSPSNAGTRTPEFNLGSAEQSPENLKKSKDIARVETGVLHRVVASEDPKEPLIGLKLGKRTYFEDVCEGNNDINSSSLASMNPSIGLVKKPKLSQHNIQSSHCQVEGCNADLTTAKDYHRKHRVCESHSKSPKVLIAGQERRFCQQCSRFHDLSEFDQKKRSCRRRLSDHNARRRKPQPETISFSPSILSSSYYDDRQQTSLIFGRASSAQVMNMANSTWDDSGGFKLIPTKGSWVNSNKSGGINGNLHFPCTGISKNISTVHHDLDRLLSFKGSTTKVLDKGLGAPVIASYLDGASDLQRALSLLSTESGVPSKPELITDFQFVNANTSHSAIHHPNNTTTGIWQQDKLPLPKAPSLLPFDLQSNVSQFQEFQLHKTPYGTLFFDSTQIH